jgi:uncharacterized protein (TIGR03086 family)
MSTKNLETAIASTRAVLANVSPSQLDDSTPCAQWKVRDLINHIVGGQFFFSNAVTGTPTPEGETDFASGAYLESFDAGSSLTIEAFGRPGVMETTYDLPFGPTPGAMFINIATSDTFTHGWDLAKSTGQDTDLEPVLAGELLDGMRPHLPAAIRNESGDPFGPEKPVSDTAPNADKLAAFLGRTV